MILSHSGGLHESPRSPGIGETMEITGVRSFNGELAVPGDKSVSHRALLIAALAEGESTISGLSSGHDVLATLRAIGQLGAVVSDRGGVLTVSGGIERLHAPTDYIDVGNSGTLIRLGAGVAAAVKGTFGFKGDESVNKRPMARVLEPLSQMGVEVLDAGAGMTAPFRIRSTRLHGIRYQMPVASAQVKSAILFAGLAAEGETTVIETVPTRYHSEEMLAQAGADIVVKRSAARREITIRARRLTKVDFSIPGDPSQAAFWIVAALVAPKSEVVVRNIYLGELRAGFLHVLKRMNANITIEMRTATSGDVIARSSALRATEILPAEIPGLIDEIPILSVAAANAIGITVVRGAKELRVKESDRISVMVEALRSFGVEVEEFSDGMAVSGTSKPRGGNVNAHLDHRIAMSAAVLGSVAGGTTKISGFDSVASSYPDFQSVFESLSRDADSHH